MNTYMQTTRHAGLVKGVLLILSLLGVDCRAQLQPTTSALQTNATKRQTDSPEGSPEFQARNPRYQLRPDDTFDVVFEFSPEFNQTVTVQPDGFITMRGIGEVHVQDMTVPQLTNTLREAYGKFLHEPAVQVVLRDFEKPYFVAQGKVARPGKYDLRADTTVTQAIALAGGFLDSAKHSQVVLYRRVSENLVEASVLDVKKMLNDRNLGEDPHLHPGDMIFVPQNRISRIERFLPIPKTSAGVLMNPATF